MSHISMSELRAARKASGNPYAYLEQLEELNHPIRRSRLKLESQYASLVPAW